MGFSGPSVRYTAVCGISLLALSVGAFPASAQEAPSPPGGQTDRSDVIVVTGARGEPRTVVESPTPIDVFTSEDIAQGSPTGVYEALRYLVPSFNLPTRAGGGTSTVVATGGLRGLNPDQTLVLVNGKRRHRTALINSVSTLYNGAAGVDLNMIPAAAIGRIEVLRDGAAAQYGSDAIAGVINIILKNSDSGGEFTSSYGENFDRGDGQSIVNSFNQGVPLGEDGFLNLSVQYIERDGSNRAVPIASSVRLYPTIGGQPDPREATIDRLVTKNYGQFPQESLSAGLNMEYGLSGETKAYAFGTYTSRQSDLEFTFRPPTDIASLPELYPNGFRPLQLIYEDDYEFAAGLRGEAAGWSWDVSSNYGLNRVDLENRNGLNASLGPSSPNKFYVGALNSSEWVNALDLTRPFDLGTAGALQVSLGLQHREEIYEVKQGDAFSYAAGTYRRPTGQPFAGQLLPQGAQATPGFRPDDAGKIERTNLSAYGELGWDPNEKLFLGIAGRYEDFDDAAGDTAIFKVNGRYELLDGLAMRASYNTGFRAPSLAQQRYSSTTSQFRDLNGDGVNELILLKNLPVASDAAVALGATPLTPEESENVALGFTLTPFSRFTLSVDAYQIDVADRITITSTFSPLDTRASATPGVTVGTQVQRILIANGLPREISGQYYTNAIDTQTKGIDVVATYGLDVGAFGDLDLSVGYNENETEITRIIANPPELAALGTIVIFDRARQGAISEATPDSKLTLTMDWTLDRFKAGVRSTRFGEYVARNATNAASDRFIDPAWITDLELSVDVTDFFSVYAGANNVFNEYPEEVAPPNNGAGFYDTLAPFGFTGGSWYLRGVFRW